MSIKERLLKIKNKINTVECMGEKIHYMHLKGSQSHLLSACKSGDIDATIFALCACEEDGQLMFTIDELEDVKQLPNVIINTVSKAALMGDEKKPRGR
ncbi:hypothetical protein PE36_00055 [Moritella sp. PE36]|uniref:hypothetical protein n=1 Tax=Moritella sp. PE36 TaxID=58051 RepID=UPI0001569147|nr:hypothetical protein [Moritella sp. PE36]EDM66142.1 hypothetical protein PE36_00055 [Moritella sp. PE36]